MITLKMDVGGVEKLIDLTIDQLAHLDKPLREFAKEHKRPEIKARFKAGGPGWPDLEQVTKDRKFSAAEVELLAAPKSGRVPARRIVANLRQIARATNSLATGKRRARIEKQAERAVKRLAILKNNLEVRTRGYVGEGRFKHVSDIVDYVERDEERRKQHAYWKQAARDYARQNPNDEAGRRKLSRRGQTRYKKADSGIGILGELANSIGAKVTRDTLELYSKAYIGGIHNEGGTAGNGAQIPARKFLEWTAKDFDVLAEMIARFAVDG